MLGRAAGMGMEGTGIGGPDVAPILGIAVHTAGSGGCREQIGGKTPRSCQKKVHWRKERGFCFVEPWSDEMSGIWDDCNE